MKNKLVLGMFVLSSSAFADSYKIVSANPKDASFIRVSKETKEGQIVFHFEKCLGDENCSQIGLKPQYTADDIRKLSLRAQQGLQQSSAGAGLMTTVGAGLGIILGAGALPTTGPGAAAAYLAPIAGARGIYEACAYPGDHYKRKVLDTIKAIGQGPYVCNSIAGLAGDLASVLDPQNRYLPDEYGFEAEDAYKKKKH